MSRIDRVHDFARLHITGKPLILYNIWNAGCEKTTLNFLLPEHVLLSAGPLLQGDG